jgi:hypothetical protein
MVRVICGIPIDGPEVRRENEVDGGGRQAVASRDTEIYYIPHQEYTDCLRRRVRRYPND